MAPQINVDTFNVSLDSVQYAGKTFVKGTQLELYPVADMNANFAGWKINNVMVPKSADGSPVYYAPMDNTVRISYVYGFILTYDSNGGSNVDQVTLNPGDPINLSIIPVREGHTFDKWDTNYREMPAYNLTVKANWIPNRYTLTFEFGNGMPDTVRQVIFGNDIELPNDPSRDGYTFAGWLGCTNDMMMPAYNLTVKAVWSKIITDDAISITEKGTVVDVDADIAEIGDELLEKMIAIAEKTDGKLDMNFSDASISMSSDALKRLALDEITGKSSNMKFSVTKAYSVSDDVLKTVSSDDISTLKGARYAVSIDVNSNGCTNGLGQVRVAVPVDGKYVGSSFIAYYVSAEGEIVPMEAVCEEINGQAYVVFYTDHFSYFALSQTDSGAGDSEGGSAGGNGGQNKTFLYIGIGAACLLIIGLIVFAILKRRYII